MTLETYENLLRVLQKRVRQGRVTGNWKAVSVATTEMHNLMNAWNQENNQPNVNDQQAGRCPTVKHRKHLVASSC